MFVLVLLSWKSDFLLILKDFSVLVVSRVSEKLLGLIADYLLSDSLSIISVAFSSFNTELLCCLNLFFSALLCNSIVTKV